MKRCVTGAVLCAAAFAAQAQSAAIAPKCLYSVTEENPGVTCVPERVVRVEKGVVTVAGSDAQYPCFDLVPTGGSWDLSPWGHVETEVCNTSDGPISINMRVDQTEPFQSNTEIAYLKPGEKRVLKVIFGYQFGFKAGPKLDPSKIKLVKLFLGGKSDKMRTFTFTDVMANGPAGEKPPVNPNNVVTVPENGRLVPFNGGSEKNFNCWVDSKAVFAKDGTIRMYMRSRPGLRVTESRDEGRTWGPVTKPAGMDQPCARCQVRALASGNWIFVKHLSPPDSYNDNKRIGQIAYLSRDEGKTWEGGLVLDARKSVTYPDVEQGPDGLIYVTHDFERGREAEIILHTFTEADILAKKFQSPKSRQGIVVMKAMGTKHNQKKYVKGK